MPFTVQIVCIDLGFLLWVTHGIEGDPRLGLHLSGLFAGQTHCSLKKLESTLHGPLGSFALKCALHNDLCSMR